MPPILRAVQLIEPERPGGTGASVAIEPAGNVSFGITSCIEPPTTLRLAFAGI